MTDEVIEQPQVAEQEAAPLTLREEIESAVKTVSEKQVDPSVKDTQETEETKAQRLRDESGKFVKKESATKTEEKAEKPALKPETATPVVAEKPKAPEHLKPAIKAKWDTLPPDVQEAIIAREEEADKVIKRQDEERMFGKQVKDVITPYMPMIQAEGSTPAIAVQSLLNTAYQLRTGTPQQKGQLIMQLAKQFGAELPQVSQGDTYVDPQVQAIQQELESLKSNLQQTATQREQQEQANINSTIAAFAADPKNVHFETVRNHMSALLKAGVAKDLQDAYDQAVYVNPDTRSALLQSQQADLEAKRVAEQKEKPDAPRKPAGSITGGPGATAPKNPSVASRSLREELEANFRSVANG